jgi:hypothetical protein
VLVSNVKRVSASHKIADRLIAAAQVAGVLVTGGFIWVHKVLPRLGFVSLAGMLLQALFYVAFAWIFAGVVAFWVYFVVALSDLRRATRFSFRTAAPAMWFAPAIVLLSTPMAGAFAASLLLIANATRQLFSQWGVVESPTHRLAPVRAELAPVFRAASLDAGFPSWHSAPVLMGSFAAQAGLVAMLWGHPFQAAALFALSTAILTSLSISTGAYLPGKPQALPHSALSVVLTFMLAAALTFGGVAIRARLGNGCGRPVGFRPIRASGPGFHPAIG